MPSTQHRDQIDLLTKLKRVEQRSQQDRNATFNNLGHLINLEMLGACFRSLDRNKAVGIDGITKEHYGSRLEENLKQLLAKIRKGSYHPKPARIVQIPKSDGGVRPLAIACLEDKIVQEAVRRIMERIYEPMFLGCSHGFRPKRGCHTALNALDKHLMGDHCGAVLEIDLRKYFNTIPHEPLIRLLKLKIQDPRFLHLIIKLLKAPTLNSDGIAERNEIGSPQGSILSPILANLYLHYVLDIWFSWISDKNYRGNARMVRYADDAVFTFYSVTEAEQFKTLLVERLNRFGIALNPEKTKAIPCGQVTAMRNAHLGLKMPSFTFLGFLHVWGKSVNRKWQHVFWRVKRRTCPKRFNKKLAEIKSYVRKHRNERTLVLQVKRIVQGYLNYFAINDNDRRVQQFVRRVRRLLFWALNRRSQRRSYTWPKFQALLDRIDFPRRIVLKRIFF